MEEQCRGEYVGRATLCYYFSHPLAHDFPELRGGDARHRRPAPESREWAPAASESAASLLVCSAASAGLRFSATNQGLRHQGARALLARVPRASQRSRAHPRRRAGAGLSRRRRRRQHRGGSRDMGARAALEDAQLHSLQHGEECNMTKLRDTQAGVWRTGPPRIESPSVVDESNGKIFPRPKTFREVAPALTQHWHRRFSSKFLSNKRLR